MRMTIHKSNKVSSKGPIRNTPINSSTCYMQPKLIVLKLVLEQMGAEPKDWSHPTPAECKKIEAAIYFAQLSGVWLGYNFSWS
jgi:hypothetical protein